jgi:replicative DNA helicase
VKEVGKLSVIMVDYLSLLKIVVPPGGTRPSAIGDVVWQCKQMAKEFDCIFMLVCMMGRSGEGTGEPKLSDLKESGDIEQHADVVEFLWIDPDDETDQNGVVVTRTIAKGRDTGMGRFKMLFRGYVQRFSDHTVKQKEKAARKK